MDWKELIAAAINTIVVLGVVQFLKIKIPVLREKIPWLFPILAMVIGPIIALVQSTLAGWLGIPIDLSAIVGLFSGGAAVAIHQIDVQATKAPTPSG